MNRIKQLIKFTGFFLITGILVGCEVPNDLKTGTLTSTNTSTATETGDCTDHRGPSGSNHCNSDSFRQPNTGAAKKLDILFAVDDSSSMNDNWGLVADNIRHMVRQFPSDVDIRYGMILGHVGSLTGKLYSAKNVEKVLSNQTLGTEQIAAKLKQSFEASMKIVDEGSGEATFYSLYKAVTKEAVNNQKLGFFRADAALAVVFVSDENEIGSYFPTPVQLAAQGLPLRCDESFELGIKKKYYDQTGINTNSVLQAVRKFKGDQPFQAHAFVNITRDDLYAHNDKRAKCLYDNLGYGYFEMVQGTGGVLYSIEKPRDEGMALLGQTMNRSLSLVHDFKLSWESKDIDPATMKVLVDANPVAFKFDSVSDSVHVENSGVSNSLVEISYCAPEAPVAWAISGINLVPSATSVSLSWQTAAAQTTGAVLWGTSDTALINTVNDSSVATSHAVTVTSLNPDSDYYFVIVARDDNGTTKQSAVLHAHTNAVNPVPTPAPDPTPVPTPAPDPGPAPAPAPTDTGTSTVTATATATATVTDTATATATATDTATATVTATATATATATQTDTSTATNTNPSPSPIPAPTNPNWQVIGFDGTTTATAATLIWQTTGAATTAVIKVGLAPDQLTLRSIAVDNAAEVQLVTVDGLTANTPYYFKVICTDANGVSRESVVIRKVTKAQ